MAAHTDGPAGQGFRRLGQTTERAAVEEEAHRPTGRAPDGVPGRDRTGAHADDAFRRGSRTAVSGPGFGAVEPAARSRDRALDHGLGQGRESTAERAPASAKGRGLVAQIGRFGTAAVRLAWACAVLGADASPRLAGAVAGLGGDEAARCAERLRAARVLAPAEPGTETLAFVHPHLATALNDAIPAATRVALHGQAAWCVIDAGLGSTAAARHLMETHPDADPWVVRHLRAAAREALRAGAPETARRCLARALREPPDRGERAAVLHELRRATLLTAPATAVDHLRAVRAEPAPGAVHRHSRLLAPGDRPATDARSRPRTQPERFLRDATRA
ncbi:hypothetical protein ACFY7C_18820 [Streptomyces sp. NPDC012769]|uniref:hypothetical protein n=1 Tax=Streptomyces sp. NPDC012769 TaxID=3364848 RepID=UPI0036AAEDE6